MALAAAAGFSADECEVAEVDRVLAKPLDHFRQRNAAKNEAGFLARGLGERTREDARQDVAEADRAYQAQQDEWERGGEEPGG